MDFIKPMFYGNRRRTVPLILSVGKGHLVDLVVVCFYSSLLSEEGFRSRLHKLDFETNFFISKSQTLSNCHFKVNNEEIRTGLLSC